MRKEERIRRAVQDLRERLQKAGLPIDDVTLEFARDVAKDHRLQHILKVKPQQLAVFSVVAGLHSSGREYSAATKSVGPQARESNARIAACNTHQAPPFYEGSI